MHNNEKVVRVRKTLLDSNDSEIRNYSLVEMDELVSKEIEVKLNRRVLVGSKLVNVDPITIRHLARVGEENMKMDEQTYRNTIDEALFHEGYQVVDIEQVIGEDNKGYYRIEQISCYDMEKNNIQIM